MLNPTDILLQGCEFTVRVSFLEIYNEELIDLLGAESVENPRLKIYEDNVKKVSILYLKDIKVFCKCILLIENIQKLMAYLMMPYVPFCD